MRYSGPYAAVLVLHLLTVLFIVGPAVVAPPLSARAVREGRAQAVRDHARTTRYYGLASLVTVALGSGLVGLGAVGDQWDYGQAWIGASYALWLLAVALLLAVVHPGQLAAADALDAGADAKALAGRIALAGGVAALAFSAIVVLMVLKPGA